MSKSHRLNGHISNKIPLSGQACVSNIHEHKRPKYIDNSLYGFGDESLFKIWMHNLVYELMHFFENDFVQLNHFDSYAEVNI